MSAFNTNGNNEDNGDLQEQQQQQQLDYYGQAVGGGQQTNLAAAAQYNELANSPELAHLLQQEASKQAALGMSYGMMTGPMMGMGAGLYRMPQEMMQMPVGVMEEEPLYVNAKQYNRILKRRQARAKLDAMIRASKQQNGEKAPYMHESRHRHAMKRPRGPGGRFLTAAEIAALKAKEASGEEAEKVETDSNGSSGAPEPNHKTKTTKA